MTPSKNLFQRIFTESLYLRDNIWYCRIFKHKCNLALIAKEFKFQERELEIYILLEHMVLHTA